MKMEDKQRPILKYISTKVREEHFDRARLAHEALREIGDSHLAEVALIVLADAKKLPAIESKSARAKRGGDVRGEQLRGKPAINERKRKGK